MNSFKEKYMNDVGLRISIAFIASILIIGYVVGAFGFLMIEMYRSPLFPMMVITSIMLVGLLICQCIFRITGKGEPK